MIGGPRVHVIDARISKATSIQRLSLRHVSYIYKNRVELSPTREKLRKRVKFITSEDSKG